MSAPTLAELRARMVAAREERYEAAEAYRDARRTGDITRVDAAENAYDDARDALLLALADALAPAEKPPEPDVPEAVRPWLEALLEVWPETRARLDRVSGIWWDMCLDGEMYASVSKDGHRGLVGSSLYASIPRLVAALRERIGGGR